ncbi:MAG: DUF262 domain-containing HNH endonuclease family protein [Verrucomicrobiota bacterium JB023]|nr:DUF262 domain-containing HNH endonuclease family protein [Verrucomicrobiota bacterium JB023]
MSEEITQHSIRTLLSSKVNYVIPMYQRNYAWDDGEITQLIQDIIDYLPAQKNYYIGTLVVYERRHSKIPTFETIDGQQRLTTLSLLASYLKNTSANISHPVDLSWYQELQIHFDSREHSSKTFAAIFDGKFASDPSEVLREKEINTAILNGYRIIARILPQKLRENNIEPSTFAEFLFSKVQIMRVKVPFDTDLNHYFEIMNNRGEQLEKHEVLKSKLMEVLNRIEEPARREQSQRCLHLVWEACANMEHYVQMGFSPAERNAIFGERDWSQFTPNDFQTLCATLTGSVEKNPSEKLALSLEDIIATPQAGHKDEGSSEESPDRFNTVINFANFLLHVLRVVTKQDVPLDDKRLISTFETHILRRTDAVPRTEHFIFALLRCKYLFDHYVLKRDFNKGSDGTEGWSLKKFKWNDGGKGNKSGSGSYVNTFGDAEVNGGGNQKILMLLSALHVSTPTPVYKHWLNAALFHLYWATSITESSYLNYLESVAKAFVFDRFLATEDEAGYFEIIYRNNGVCQSSLEAVSRRNLDSVLSFGAIKNNLVFNFLDYVLWLKLTKETPIKTYEFTFRSSVEHYYPQHPRGHEQLPPEVLNQFGNLCLISHSKNSRLSDFMPTAKKEYYVKGQLDSIKQHLMMQEDPWDTAAILRHSAAMKKVLIESLESIPIAC